jgi:Na+/phosphate symporter
MAQLLQGNPQLWAVAGDLFVKNMDWPGAQEMAKRFAKTIDPKLMDDSEDNPALAAAQQQMQAMGQEMEQMHQMIQNVGKSIEMQEQRRKDYEAEIKAYQAETQRITAVQAGLNEQQVQDIAMGVVAAAMESNDLIGQRQESQEPANMMEPGEPNEMQ